MRQSTSVDFSATRQIHAKGKSFPLTSRIGPRPIRSSVSSELGLRFSPKGLPVSRRVVKAFQPDGLSTISYIKQSV
ncbi:MAG: hypothetical protein IKX43_11940 [Paludibacteraceae bacterium]|nr:hypothetical protein [Paludibacteraceae bacterium]